MRYCIAYNLYKTNNMHVPIQYTIVCILYSCIQYTHTLGSQRKYWSMKNNNNLQKHAYISI